MISLFKPTKLEWQHKFLQKQQRVADARLRRFYQSPPVSGETVIGSTPLVALDFETTGLNPNQHDILSIGLVPFDLHRIRLQQARYWTVKPEDQLHEESVVIHGITHSKVQRAPDLIDVLDEVLDCLAGKVVVVHYQHIERPFFDSALRKRINEGIEFPLIDTMEIESQWAKQQFGGWLNRLKGKSLPSVRLAQSRRRYGLPDYSAHHALTDAIATAELFQAQIAHHFSSQTPVSELWR
ncbi:TPA: 3'-5' exonuclease [Vibrio vulnificus]|nr:3'-5' exonuclease [Vibrio vulnificus]